MRQATNPVLPAKKIPTNNNIPIKVLTIEAFALKKSFTYISSGDRAGIMRP